MWMKNQNQTKNTRLMHVQALKYRQRAAQLFSIFKEQQSTERKKWKRNRQSYFRLLSAIIISIIIISSSLTSLVLFRHVCSFIDQLSLVSLS